MVNLAPKLVSIEETFSIPELQQRTWTRMTGAEIAAHNAAAEPLNILCLEDGSGFLKGHIYVITDDGIIYDAFQPHDHSSTALGGTLYEIKRANYKDLIELDMSANIFAAAFNKNVVGTGTITDDLDNTAGTKSVKILTTAANNDATNGELGGGRISFGKPLTFQVKYSISTNVSVNYRMGIGTPRIQDNIGVNAQLGFEGCTGTNTKNRVFSADGTTWSAEDMLDMSQSVPFGLRIDWYPTSKIVAQDGEGTFITKITNLPPPATATNGSSLLRTSIKTLTTAARNLNIHALRLVGSSHDSVSGVKGWL
jgi:hypothetical protein